MISYYVNNLDKNNKFYFFKNVYLKLCLLRYETILRNKTYKNYYKFFGKSLFIKKTNKINYFVNFKKNLIFLKYLVSTSIASKKFTNFLFFVTLIRGLHHVYLINAKPFTDLKYLVYKNNTNYVANVNFICKYLTIYKNNKPVLKYKLRATSYKPNNINFIYALLFFN